MVYEIGHCSFSQIVSNFVPVVYDAPADVQNEAFFQALDFVHRPFRRLRERFNYIRACRQKVADAMVGNKKFMVFEEPMPWIDNFFDLGGEQHPALFVVMPSGGHWKLRSIPPNNEDRMNMRMALPERWAGLQDQELKKATKIPRRDLLP